MVACLGPSSATDVIFWRVVIGARVGEEELSEGRFCFCKGKESMVSASLLDQRLMVGTQDSEEVFSVLLHALQRVAKGTEVKDV